MRSTDHHGQVLSNGRTTSLWATQDRHIKSRAVECPTCGAEVGEACASATGKRATHPSRRRMAIRAENASYDLDDALFARSLTSRGRMGLRLRAGLSRRALAELIGVEPHLVTKWEQHPVGPSGGPDAARYGAWLRGQLNTG